MPPTPPPDVVSQFESSPAPQPSLLTVQLENLTAYYQDTVDLAQLAMQQEVSIASSGKPGSQTENFYNMFPLLLVGDIVGINGDTTVTGLYLSKNVVTVSSTTVTRANPNVAIINGVPITSAGLMISDAPIIGLRYDYFKVLCLDPMAPATTPPMTMEIGSITASGVSGKPMSPGQPADITGGDWAITGGTGAFLGVTGQMGGGGGGGTIRMASVTEDPSQRRNNAVNANPPATATMGLYVIPLTPPHIIEVFHAAYGNNAPTPVSLAHPANVGETLTLYATGLGPVRYKNEASAWVNVPIGQLFPANTTVISPVTVTIGNRMAAIQSATGYPDVSNGYSVEFIVPPVSTAGLTITSIQISSAWIRSAVVKLYVFGVPPSLSSDISYLVPILL